MDSREETSGIFVTPRWAVRSLPDGQWTYFDGPEQNTARLQLGFDDVSEMLVFAAFDAANVPVLSSFDLDGIPGDQYMGTTQLTDVGAPACVAGVCTFPVADAADGGPRFGRLEVVVDQGQLLVSEPVFVGGIETQGRVGAGADEPGFLRMIAGPQRFRVDSSDLGSDPQPLPAPMFLNGDWPLSQSVYAGRSTRHALVSAVALECGNGIVQGTEECDDSNLVPGDGCDAECLLEGDMGETGGGLDELGDNGCECSASNRGSSPVGCVGLVLAGLLLLPVRRSRRNQR